MAEHRVLPEPNARLCRQEEAAGSARLGGVEAQALKLIIKLDIMRGQGTARPHWYKFSVAQDRRRFLALLSWPGLFRIN